MIFDNKFKNDIIAMIFTLSFGSVYISINNNINVINIPV